MLGNPIILKQFEGHYPLKLDGQIPENGFQSLENFLVTSRGTLRARPGLTTIGSAGFQLGEIRGIWTQSDGTRFLIIDEFNSSALGVTQLSMDGDTATTISNGTICSLLLQWNDEAYIFAQVTALKTWDGTTATTTPVTVTANVGTVFKSRMFVANNSSGSLANTQVRYSEIFDLDAPDTTDGWPSLNTIDINSQDGDFITAMAVLNDTLIVFKRFSTWAVYVEGLPPWTVRNLHPNIGCIGRDTVQVIGGLLYFRAATGVYRTDGTTFELLSDPIKELLDDEPGMIYNECNARSGVWWGEYYLLNDMNSDVSSTATHWEAYNLETGAWSRLVFDGPQMSRAILDVESSPPKLLVMEKATATNTGNLREFVETNDYEDDGANIQCEAVSKMYDFDKPADWKLVREIDVAVSLESPFNTQTASMTTTNEYDAQTVQVKTLNAEQRSLFRFRGPMRCRAAGYTLLIEPAGGIEIDQIIFDTQVVGRVGLGH